MPLAARHVARAGREEAAIALQDRLAAVVAHRRILWLLISRDLKLRYAQSALGYLWTVLDPLLMSLVYWFVFTRIFNGRDVGADPYIVYLVVGMLAWNWANGAINDSTRALTSESKIVRSANLNREIWVLRIVGAKALEFLMSLPVLALRGDDHDLRLSGYVFAVPLAMVLQAAATTGIGLMLAPLTVLFKDVQRLVRIFLRILFYLTPVIYGVQNVPEDYRWVFAFNPFAGIVELYRAALFPAQFGGWGHVGIAAAISFGLLALGIWTFRRLEGRVLKEL